MRPQKSWCVHSAAFFLSVFHPGHRGNMHSTFHLNDSTGEAQCVQWALEKWIQQLIQFEGQDNTVTIARINFDRNHSRINSTTDIRNYSCSVSGKSSAVITTATTSLTHQKKKNRCRAMESINIPIGLHLLPLRKLWHLPPKRHCFYLTSCYRMPTSFWHWKSNPALDTAVCFEKKQYTSIKILDNLPVRMRF